MWKATLIILGFPLGGLTGVAILRACRVDRHVSFQLASAIAVSALLGALAGAVLGVAIGWRLDKIRKARGPQYAGRHRLAAIGVAVLATIIGFGLGAYCFRFRATPEKERLVFGPQSRHVLELQFKLHAEPDHAGTVASELIGIATDSQRDAGIQAFALSVLNEIGPEQKSAVPILTDGLNNPNLGVRWKCAGALGRIGHDARLAVPQLTAALADSDLAIRRGVASALWSIERKADLVVPVLAATFVEQAKRGERWECSQLAGLLQSIGPEADAAVPSLIGLLRENKELVAKSPLGADIDRDIRFTAAYTLGAIGPNAKEAIPALNAARNDPSQLVAKTAAEALAKIQTQTEAEKASDAK